MTATRTRQAPALPGAALSMFDPVFAGLDETGQPVYLDFADHMGIILAGEPGAGKSVGLTNIVAHGALSWSDCRLILIDGALVELGAWRSCADTFVGPITLAGSVSPTVISSPEFGCAENCTAIEAGEPDGWVIVREELVEDIRRGRSCTECTAS